jgi:hypothetical protein
LLRCKLSRWEQFVRSIKRHLPGLRSSFASALDGSGDEIIWIH